MKKFEVGKSYFGRFASDYDSVFTYKVVRRTDKTVWLKCEFETNLRQCRVQRGWNGEYEFVYPMGSGYSMAPMLSADREVQ